MEHLFLKSKCSIFHGILKYIAFKRRQKALSWGKGFTQISFVSFSWDLRQSVQPHNAASDQGLHLSLVEYILFGLTLYVPVNNFSIMSGQVLVG